MLNIVNFIPRSPFIGAPENGTKMENWKKISLFVGIFAFAREFRPIEPFYAAYMTSPLINCTVEQVIDINSYIDFFSIGYSINLMYRAYAIKFPLKSLSQNDEFIIEKCDYNCI